MRQIKYNNHKLRFDKLFYHYVPIGCMLALLLLNIIIINPTINSNTYALNAFSKENNVNTNNSNDAGASINSDISNNNVNNISNEGNTDNTSSDNEDGYIVYDVDENIDVNDSESGIAPLADLTTDGVTLVWNSSDDPIQSTYGDSSTVLYRYNRFNVTADNIKQYQILANVVDNANGSNGNKLIGYTSTDSTIQNGSSIDAISNSNGIVGKDLTSTTTSQWGYAIADGEVTSEASLANLTYKAVPAASSSTSGKTEAVTSLNNRAFTIAFAANIADDKPAGSYRTNVEVSVVVEPKPLTAKWSNGLDSGITYMQEMTGAVCEQVSTPAASETNVPTLTLRDSRVTSESEPGYQYTIARLADGNCWMTQNLKLVDKTITSTDSDVTSDFTIPASNAYGFTKSNQNQPKAYLDSTYGGYYNWYTATAGTGDASIKSGNAPSSICPKGWQLPTSNNTDAKQKSFGGLTTAYNISNDEAGSTKLRSAPLNFIYGGYVSSSPSDAGSGGCYWSSTATSSTIAYSLYFLSSIVEPSNSYNVYRFYGFSVRCVAK